MKAWRIVLWLPLICSWANFAIGATPQNLALSIQLIPIKINLELLTKSDKIGWLCEKIGEIRAAANTVEDGMRLGLYPHPTIAEEQSYREINIDIMEISIGSDSLYRECFSDNPDPRVFLSDIRNHAPSMGSSIDDAIERLKQTK